MFVVDFLFAVVVAILLTTVFAGGFRRIGPWASLIWFFVIVLLAAWAGGVWLRPMGPAIWGVHWMPFLWIGLLVALLLAASAPAKERRTPRDEDKRAEISSKAVALGTFFWVLLIAFLAALVLHYSTRPVV